jgi:hypothetical protein
MTDYFRRKRSLILLIVMTVLKVKCQTYVGTGGGDINGCGSDASPCSTLTYVINTIKPSSIFIKTSTSCVEVTLSNTLSIASSDSNFATVTCSTSFKFTIGDYEVTLSKIQFSFQGTNDSDLFTCNYSGKYTINNCLFKPDSSLNNLSLNVSLFKIGNVAKDSGPTDCNFAHMSASGDNAIFYLNHQGSTSFTLTRCVFTYCISNSSGGCIYVPSSQVNLTFNRCQFIHCSAVSKGGAIAQVNGMYGGYVIITSCTFNNCTTTGSNSQGGAIYAYPAQKETFVMNETSFTSCSATPSDGGRGGVAFFSISSGGNNDTFKFNGTLTFTSCNASEGRHFFFEYQTQGTSTVCVKDNFDYTFSSEVCTIYMKRKDSETSETMITTTCLGVAGVC